VFKKTPCLLNKTTEVVKMKPLKMIVYLIALSSLMGCSHATLSRDDCVRGDWLALGVQDGMNGKTVGELNLHKQACLDYGITPDSKSYLTGREKGLLEYCRLDNAVTSGLNGQLYQSVCPKEVDEAFRKQNAAAYNLYLNTMRNSYYNNGYYYGGFGSYYGGFGLGFGGRRGFGFSPFGGFRWGGRW